MEIKFGCTYWGSAPLAPAAFIDKALTAGYDGVEVLLFPPDPLSDAFSSAIAAARSRVPGFFFVPMQISFSEGGSVNDLIGRMLRHYEVIARLQPDFINAHTGRDFYSFDDNCRVIDAAMNFGAKEGIRIVHETHRGRFSFHAASLLPYLQRFPQMQLAGDLSHFCTVSESMLEEQEDILNEIFPFITHIHARVGHEQGPQVSDPDAPEWKTHLDRFVHWWRQIVRIRKAMGQTTLTITPEFGPTPYMPAAPHTLEPLGNQWECNLFMLKHLREQLLQQES
jgi:sugar phosphate isomerase/epimerase